jgi:preprotein translocase subunit SecA
LDATAENLSATISESTPFSDRNARGRFGPRWLNHLRAWLGLPSQRRLARGALQIDRIRYWEQELSGLSDAEVKQRAQQFRGRARGGASLTRLLPEVFGLVCVVARRALGFTPLHL